MKKIMIIPAVFLAFICFISNHRVKADDDTSEYKINSEFSNKKLKLKENNLILDYKLEDVNGDNVKDNVLLVGGKETDKETSWSKNIVLVIQDGKNKKYYKTSIGKIDYGYNVRMFLGDFNGDRVSDVFISASNGEKGRTSSYSLISFKKNKVNCLINQEKFSKGMAFDLEYTEDFNVDIYSKKYNIEYLLDVSGKKDIYIDKKIYKNSGKVLKKTKGFHDGFVELRPVDIDMNGIYELRGVQRLYGICEADEIGYAKSLWKFDNSEVSLYKVYIVPYDKPENFNKVKRVVPVMKIN